jgi:hypothetical protein
LTITFSISAPMRSFLSRAVVVAALQTVARSVVGWRLHVELRVAVALVGAQQVRPTGDVDAQAFFRLQQDRLRRQAESERQRLTGRQRPRRVDIDDDFRGSASLSVDLAARWSDRAQ